MLVASVWRILSLIIMIIDFYKRTIKSSEISGNVGGTQGTPGRGTRQAAIRGSEEEDQARSAQTVQRPVQHPSLGMLVRLAGLFRLLAQQIAALLEMRD
ncbi:MAG: hypothetical protein Kow00124_28660 [Anaerolineae bacterium]